MPRVSSVSSSSSSPIIPMAGQVAAASLEPSAAPEQAVQPPPATERLIQEAIERVASHAEGVEGQDAGALTKIEEFISAIADLPAPLQLQALHVAVDRLSPWLHPNDAVPADTAALVSSIFKGSLAPALDKLDFGNGPDLGQAAARDRLIASMSDIRPSDEASSLSRPTGRPFESPLSKLSKGGEYNLVRSFLTVKDEVVLRAVSKENKTRVGEENAVLWEYAAAMTAKFPARRPSISRKFWEEPERDANKLRKAANKVLTTVGGKKLSAARYRLDYQRVEESRSQTTDRRSLSDRRRFAKSDVEPIVLARVERGYPHPKAALLRAVESYCNWDEGSANEREERWATVVAELKKSDDATKNKWLDKVEANGRLLISVLACLQEQLVVEVANHMVGLPAGTGI